jgi:hypothetical protein
MLHHNRQAQMACYAKVRYLKVDLIFTVPVNHCEQRCSDSVYDH